MQVTAIDVSVAGVTVSPKLFEVIPFSAAEMLVGPGATPAACPPAMVATAVLEEFQVAWLVMLLVELLL